jgi:hypothetical protein
VCTDSTSHLTPEQDELIVQRDFGFRERGPCTEGEHVVCPLPFSHTACESVVSCIAFPRIVVIRRKKSRGIQGPNKTKTPEQKQVHKKGFSQIPRKRSAESSVQRPSNSSPPFQSSPSSSSPRNRQSLRVIANELSSSVTELYQSRRKIVSIKLIQDPNQLRNQIRPSSSTLFPLSIQSFE